MIAAWPTQPSSRTDIAQGEPRWRVMWRNAFPFLVVGAIWESVARAGMFPARLFPSLETIAAAFWRLTAQRHPAASCARHA